MIFIIYKMISRTCSTMAYYITRSVKKGVLGYFAKFTGKHLRQRLFFDKVAGLRPATLLKNSLWHRCFLVNFAKFLRTPFSKNTSGRLLPYEVPGFSNLKSYVKSPNLMIDKCVVACVLLVVKLGKRKHHFISTKIKN